MRTLIASLRCLSPARRATLLLLLLASTAAPAQNADYLLGPGDVLSIHVYEEQDLSFTEMRIGDTGMINYPLLGEVAVTGTTTPELEQLLRERLVEGEFLIAPAVTVTIVEYRPFYINGEVTTPGSYPFQPGLTLRKAISIAGGFTERANRKRFTVHAGSTAEDTTPNTVTSLDTSIAPGAIITIDERFF